MRSPVRSAGTIPVRQKEAQDFVHLDDAAPRAAAEHACMPELLDRLKSLIEAERTRFGVAGCAVVIVRGADVLMSEGFGQRRVDPGLPVTKRTLFPIGSSTKTFTAALCGSLVEGGELEWDRPLVEYFRNFRMHDPVASQLLTVRDCLSHRSGLPRHDLLWVAGEGALTRDDLIASLAHLPSSKPFRQNMQYSSLLYIAAGHFAGQLVSENYEDAVRQRLLAPLGMTRTNFDVETTLRDSDHALPYVQRFGEDQPRAVPHASLGLAGPAGNINSCAEDLEAWLLALLGHGVNGRPPVLSETILQELRAPTAALPTGDLNGIAQPVAYGLGLFLGDYRGSRIAYHGGNIDGFSSQVLTVPDSEIGIAILTNLDGTPLREALAYQILDVLGGIEAQPHGERLHARMSDIGRGTVETQERKPVGQGNGLRYANLSLDDYVGSYRHLGYGTIVVRAESEGLRGAYLGLPESPLEHMRLDVFELVVAAKGGSLRLPMQFTRDFAGDVDGLRLIAEKAVAPLRFEREHERTHITDGFLSRCEGVYQLGSITASITRRGESELLLSIASGPSRLLKFAGGRAFTVEGARIEFETPDRLVTRVGEFVKLPSSGPGRS